MKRRIVFSMVCIVVAAALLWWGVRPVPNQQAEVASETIALVLDTDIGTGALQMKQGAKLAAKEQKVDLLTAAPDYAGGTVISQAELIGTLLQKNVKAILLVPAAGEQLGEALTLAEEMKVPVLALGGASLPGKVACTISDDFVRVGQMAGQALLERVPSPGRLVLITGGQADAEAALRLRGAMEAIAGAKELTVVKQITDTGLTADSLLTLLAAFGDVNGVLCLTANSTEVAAKAASRYGQTLCVVGIDCGQNRTTYLENRQVDAMVLGMPFAMGYLGVQFATQAMQGKELPSSYSTESRVIDLENMYLPENQKLAFPMLQ